MNRGLEAPREPIITYYFFLLKNIYRKPNTTLRYVPLYREFGARFLRKIKIPLLDVANPLFWGFGPSCRRVWGVGHWILGYGVGRCGWTQKGSK